MNATNDTPALARLEEQIAWYSAKSAHDQRLYKLLKASTMTVAALVPVLVAVGVSDARITAALTASIAVIEGIQQLNQYHANWIAYRSTCEALKHEKYLYLSGAGPYATAPKPLVTLAERTEALLSQENATWMSAVEQSTPSGLAKPMA